VLLLVSSYLVNVVGQKITTIGFNFLKLLDSVVSFPEVVCDNVVSNDVTITS